MKPAHAVVALGLVAMVTGAVSLHAVSRGSTEVVDEVAEIPARTDVVTSGWEGVDPSIQRVLSEVGLAERYPESRLEEIPEEVVRVLSALGLPLVLSDRSGESG